MNKRAQQVRIIGGRWRGRKIAVHAAPDLRPTPDRVRETLFNWLAGSLPGARCLDLFAGTGALGFEALSRGADYVCLVESQTMVARQLASDAERLEANVEIKTADDQSVLISGLFPGSFYDCTFAHTDRKAEAVRNQTVSFHIAGQQDSVGAEPHLQHDAGRIVLNCWAKDLGDAHNGCVEAAFVDCLDSHDLIACVEQHNAQMFLHQKAHFSDKNISCISRRLNHDFVFRGSSHQAASNFKRCFDFGRLGGADSLQRL